MLKTPQLTLAVQLPDDETFDSFVLGDNMAEVHRLKSFVSQVNITEKLQSFYLFGTHGVGKSHLLHASCSFAESLNLSTFCISFSQLTDLSIEVLEGLETFDLICLDDVQLIAGNDIWQRGVFDLFNRVTEQGKKIIITGNNNVKNLSITLPDLISRLAWGETEAIKQLNDDDKVTALQFHAHQRGMQLLDDAAKFLINRHARDMSSLIDSLDLLDKASIREQRKITIPFIKDVLFNH